MLGSFEVEIEKSAAGLTTMDGVMFFLKSGQQQTTAAAVQSL